MTEKVTRFSGFRPMTDEQSEFFVKNLLDVFRQLDKINDMRGHTHDETLRSDSPSDHGDPGDRQDGPTAS